VRRKGRCSGNSRLTTKNKIIISRAGKLANKNISCHFV
jgi:hypothetical protein